MRRLRVITPEEQRILDGGAVDKAAYTARAVFTVDSEKLLERGRLISVRAHTRREKRSGEGSPPFGGCAASACLSASPKTGGAKKKTKTLM